ncbi:MAG: type IV toxin-antitoxin system AbiEi family antitoxin domain-containing protein [Solirubrobacterales bacterium]|nr:type IV toxin-antitoxin system AbiEi family antitoxin domain-containing protein [Solirubrobacterales bacterium]
MRHQPRGSCPDGDPRNRRLGPDVTIAALASRQHGVVTRAQLLASGLTPGQIVRRTRRGQLHVLYRGVYAVGHRELPRRGRALAAAWSAGPRGLLFDVAAAALHGVRESSAARWDIALPQERRWTGQRGIRAHAVSTLLPEDITTVDGVPVTTLPRTVVDLAARHPARTVEKVLNEMVALDVYDQRALDTLLDRPYLRGTKQLRAILGRQQAGTTVTKSELEELLIALCDTYGIPRPRTNAWVIGLEVDAWWPGTLLVVELDSARFHGSPAAFERDREKGNELVVGGYTLLRFTWRQLVDDPAWVARTIRTALARLGR